MSYEPHLVANYKTGIQKDLQPWLIPDEAQEQILDGYVHHGVMRKREGYSPYANGIRDSEPWCESRIVQRVEDEATGRTNNGGVLANFTLSNIPVRRGNVTISDGVEDHTDDGEGGFPTAAGGAIDYVTGVISLFQFNANSGNAVTATYDFYNLEPVMMITTFINTSNIKTLLVADTKRVNRYNATTNKLDDITVTQYTGDSHDFFTSTQYPTELDTPRLLFTNNVDQIDYYDGDNVGKFYPTITSSANSTTLNGDGTSGPYTTTLSVAAGPIMPREVSITAGGQTVYDDGMGNLDGDGDGTINYTTGALSVTFDAAVVVGVGNITVNFLNSVTYVITAEHMFNYQDRLVLLRTTETGGTVHPQRIRHSAVGENGDDFRVGTTVGAAVIDIPTQYWITGAEFNRDDLIIYTERETWILKYTNNDIVPFTLHKIDGSRGNKAPRAPISYLNFTKAYSPIGFTVTDGYQVIRNDEKIPDFSWEEIDQDNFDLLFSGSVSDDNNHYLIYPTTGETASDRILINNYDENNFSIYRLPLSCMGEFQESFDITWAELTPPEYNNWNNFGNKFGTWSAISYTKDSPISLGGGQEGEIWRLNANDTEDNLLHIWDVQQNATGPLTVDFTTDRHNFVVGDQIYISGTSGSTEINSKQALITTVTDQYNFTAQFDNENPASITAWTENGFISRVIPFEFVSKNFNPYTAQGERVRCGWVYFYVSTDLSNATDIDGNKIGGSLIIDVYANDTFTSTGSSPIYSTQVDFGYEANISNFDSRKSLKVWRKVFINQNARFLQFRVRNAQAGTNIAIHGMEFGFMPGGRMI